MARYKFRAETMFDLCRFMGALAEESNSKDVYGAHLRKVKVNMNGKPETYTCEFEAAELLPVVRILRTIPDGHRMIQTLKPAADWNKTEEDWNEDEDAVFIAMSKASALAALSTDITATVRQAHGN